MHEAQLRNEAGDGSLFETISHEPRDVIVPAFVEGAGLTPNGAQKYLYNCKRRAQSEPCAVMPSRRVKRLTPSPFPIAASCRSQVSRCIANREGVAATCADSRQQVCPECAEKSPNSPTHSQLQMQAAVAGKRRLICNSATAGREPPRVTAARAACDDRRVERQIDSAAPSIPRH